MFRKKGILFFTILGVQMMLLLSCDNSNSSYIISKQDSLFKTKHTDSNGVVLMPPNVKYAMYTFVIDSNRNVYFYSLPEEKQNCGVFDEAEPDVLNLLPNQVLGIPRGLEKEFFEKNVLLQKSSRTTKSIMLSSFKDTISGDFLKYLRNVSGNEKNRMSLNIRLALPEEREVIKSKTDRQH